jgi:hypothetical protein
MVEVGMNEVAPSSKNMFGGNEIRRQETGVEGGVAGVQELRNTGKLLLSEQS